MCNKPPPESDIGYGLIVFADLACTTAAKI